MQKCKFARLDRYKHLTDKIIAVSDSKEFWMYVNQLKRNNFNVMREFN